MQPKVLLMDEPFAALDALTRRKMQEELLILWEEVRFTLLFVTHCIEEALIVGSRMLLLSPHPGRVRAEINCHQFAMTDQGSEAFQATAQRIHHLLFPTEGMTPSPATSHQGKYYEHPAPRPEYQRELTPLKNLTLALPLPLTTRLWNQAWLRKITILLGLIILWELAARWQNNALMFPGFLQTFDALHEDVANGSLPGKVLVSLSTLLKGYAVGSLLALGLSALAVSSRIGRDLLATLTSMFNPLPAIALLPLALLWFGLGEKSLVFVLIHSVMWPMALNTYSGFLSVSETLRMTGRNYGLNGRRYVAYILIPAALPSILSGLKIGWAFAWRTLIAAELVFGASSGNGGLGWYIFQNRNELYTDRVFAGLASVIIIGLLVEGLIFSSIEKITVKRWGMQR
ncbi:NitT/TauT family transport system permease protein [Brenneria salicis ATCC 15712 = DSM 30166]|uniref:NitT/TauT family transport system permease protein n=2 Tax=Brenneria salicis TaxID=55214 RepID=A0A366HYL0_9GAMM|nr:NitT/TauT family transport system permease protein [Brenneria salicis ATCC 15712 = DSM 30166]